MSPVIARYPVRTAPRIATRSTMAAGDCLFLQRRVGNRVVRSLIAAASPELRRAAAIDDDLHLQAPIFTSSGQFSRLDNAFHNRPTLTAADNGPAVRVFQEALVAAGERLPKSTKPDGQLDGVWGNEITAAVARFQAANGIEPGGFEAGRKTLLALDAHLKSVQPNPPGPQPQPKPSPTPRPPQDNQELETAMNQISIAYQLLITRERDGLLALCRDLSGLDKPQPSALLVTAGTLLQILAPPLYGFAEGALRIAIKKALNSALNPADEVLTDLDNMNDKVCDGIFASFSDAISGLKQPSPDETRADLLADYCDAQLDQVTKAGFKALSQFEDAGKSAIRNSKPSAQKRDPRNRSGDPRIDGALAVRDAVNQTADAAFAVRYDRALQAWDTQLAQSQLGVDEEDVRNTNLDSLKNDAAIPAGVLRVVLDLSFDGKSEKIIGATIDGLSSRVRKKLTGKTGAGLKLPIIAEGSTGSRRMRIGINEGGRVIDLTTSNSGDRWLKERGDGDRRQGVLRVADTVLGSPMPGVESA